MYIPSLIHRMHVMPSVIQLLKMPLVTHYKHLSKPDRHGAPQLFNSFRAAGLALELGWKKSRDLGAVSAGDLQRVKVAGPALKLYDEGRWRGVPRCTLQLESKDATLALSVLRQQRTLLCDLRLNVWFVDKTGDSHTFDLVADIVDSRNFGVESRVWVELKIFSATTFMKEIKKLKRQLPTALVAEQHANLGGVLLLAAKVDKSSGTTTQHAFLYSDSEQAWHTLAGGEQKVGRGQLGHTKPSLAQVWSEVEWTKTREGEDVGYLKHFLQALGKPAKNQGQRASTFNGQLKDAGHDGRVYQAAIRNKSGSPAWVASKGSLRLVYKLN